jgi:DNA-binding XRE family transcriptional regulator
MSPRPALEGAIYNRLGELRAEHGLSRAQLANALRVNYQTVGYLERGEYFPSLELAMRIAAYFEVPIEHVFSRKQFLSTGSEPYNSRAGETS